MIASIDQLIAFVSANAWLAYLTIFLAALLEAAPVLGSVIPGSTIILALAALIPDGELGLIPVLACAITGAVIGDGTAFTIGHRQQRAILTAWPLSRYPGVVARSEDFFNRYGAPAVFFARFLAPIRAFVPVTAGALGMPPQRFFAINLPAIVVWSLAHVLPALLAVTLLERFGGFAELRTHAKHYWMPLVLGAGVLAGLAVWFVRRRRGINLPVRKGM